ncbi:MAG: RloB domain-containing protein [Methanomassiliicoccus sp.]|nr:RloB domain-containing protein [Methanomassiliicoccus sp.]
MLVVVEGETENNYFRGLKERDSNIEIVLVKPGPADPIHLVEACMHHMREMAIDIEDGDVAVCVFDVDENPVERMLKALGTARENGITIALTNPCFELWLALHFQDVYHPLDRRDAVRLIRKHLPRYAKTADLTPVLGPGRSAAMTRSMGIMTRNSMVGSIDVIRYNPSSSVHLALEAIDALKARNRERKGNCR